MDSCELGCRHGHILVSGKWRRCLCMEKRIASTLGVFASEVIRRKTPLLSLRETNLLIEGSFVNLRPHISGVLVRMALEGSSFSIFDAYRLVDIYIEKDNEFENLGQLLEKNLVLLLLGFGDVKNQRLPELVHQFLVRRMLLSRPVWIILGIERANIIGRYSVEVDKEISNYKRVKI